MPTDDHRPPASLSGVLSGLRLDELLSEVQQRLAEIEDLRAQRGFAIACGHPDGNDGDRLADDPIHKLLLDRDPIDGGR